ncbi:unnamed protein product [Amoebophrya sp. A120]|nr:unnamed protein product [Amoebophrya sp. A120]|eukprot:GSA120T00001066001.1
MNPYDIRDNLGAQNAAEDVDLEQEDFEVDELVCIIDNGSALTKVGMSCDDQPVSVFPTDVGIPRRRHRKKCDRDFYCGNEVAENQQYLSVSHPVEGAVIENFQHIEMLWDYIFVDVLQIQPEKHGVLITEPPYNPKPNRERTVELMFEAFGVPSLSVRIQGVLALMGQGRTTGLVLDAGAGVTHAIPILDGYGMPYNIKKMHCAGRELDVYLAKLLAKAGYQVSTSFARREIVKMKERLCYVSMDPTEERVIKPAIYKMPDGEKIQLGEECWKCPEALFNPGQLGIEAEAGGVAGLIWDCVAGCEIDTRRPLLQNIVLSGGTTMFKNFDARLSRELMLMSSSQLPTRVVTTATDRKNSVWQGAQVFANLGSMQRDLWITAGDYDEYGAGYIHEKVMMKYS